MGRAMARNAALFFVLAVLADGLFSALTAGPGSLWATFYLALFIHAGFTLYDGRFDARRTATWLVLIAAWAGAEFAGFLGYVLPWGQLNFWLMGRLAAAPGGEEIFLFPWDLQQRVSWLGSLMARVPMELLLMLCVLCLDVAAMHREAWRRRSFAHAAVFLAATVAAVIIFDVIAGLLIGRPVPSAPDLDVFATPKRIIWPWYELPLYAMLRAVPVKLAAVVTCFSAMVVLVIWPWVRADALRTGPLRRVWLVLCLALAAVWIGLGYVGSLPPDPLNITVAQALLVFYFAFFLIWPPVLHKIAAAVDSRRRAGGAS
jgi:quinol-cytochrome oxidoreductase complex cytochrome b subunit